eukprot:10216302-Lingulodinium_polyedra.AAC.1
MTNTTRAHRRATRSLRSGLWMTQRLRARQRRQTRPARDAHAPQKNAAQTRRPNGNLAIKNLKHWEATDDRHCPLLNM